MPYESNAQRRAMHAKAARGEIAQSVIDEYDRASKGLDLPERKMAEGGEVEKAEGGRRKTTTLEMPAVQHVAEQDDHFIVTFADGQSTTVLKEGLKPDTLAHIQGMAHGGEVRALGGSGGTVDPGEAEGGGPSPSEPTTKAKTLRWPQAVRLSTTGSGDVGGRPDVPDDDPGDKPSHTHGEEIPSYADGGMVDAGAAQDQFLPFNPMGPTDAGFAPLPAVSMEGPPGFTPMPPAEPLMPSLRPDALAASAAIDKMAPYGKPNQGAVKGAPPGPAIVPPLQKPTPAPTAQPEQYKLPSFGGSGALTELNKGLAEERAGLAAQVEAEKARDAALLQLQDSHIAQMQALEAQHAEQRELLQRRADDLFAATLNNKIDPNRVWANADLGQRIGAGIGILLSGIGQGLSGGPNLALQQIDRTIDRDIAAQRDNLETQKGLLAHYLQQGRDMLSAQALTKADLKDMLAAQIAKVSAQFGGQEMAARALLLGGQIRTDAAGKRAEISAKEFQQQSQRLSMQLAMEQQRMMSAIVSAPRTTAGGLQAPPQMLEALPKDMRERAVHLPDGSIGFAPDAERARKLTEGLTVLNTTRQMLGSYAGLMGGFKPVTPAVFGGTRRLAGGSRASLLLQLKEMENLGVLQKQDLEVLEPMLPDLTEATTSDKTHQQGFAALQRELAIRIDANLRSVLGAR